MVKHNSRALTPDPSDPVNCLVGMRDAIQMEIDELERQNAENVMAISRKHAEISEIHKEVVELLTGDGVITVSDLLPDRDSGDTRDRLFEWVDGELVEVK